MSSLSEIWLMFALYKNSCSRQNVSVEKPTKRNLPVWLRLFDFLVQYLKKF